MLAAGLPLAGFAEDAHDTFGPLLLGLLVHLINQHGLDEPMDRERGGFGVAVDE